MFTPPPMPFDQFPIAVRVLGRPTLEALWWACFRLGVGSGVALGFALGILFAAVLGIAIRNLQDRPNAQD